MAKTPGFYQFMRRTASCFKRRQWEQL